MKRTIRFFGLLALALSACTNRLADDVPRLYACDRADGLNSCPGGWRCGLSGFCQDPAQALPYACEAWEDCSATWHCGQERLCYDRAAARERSCRADNKSIPDAGDCAPGWRCGREVRGQVCHALDAGAAYLCASDSDCEANWRCGPEGICVDVGTQGLRAGEVTLTATKLSPLLPGRVDLMSLRVEPQGTNLAFVADGRLSLVTSSTPQGQFPNTTRESTPLVLPAHALVQTEDHLILSDSTGLVDYRDALDGGVAVRLTALANAELRYAPRVSIFGTAALEELAAFSGTAVGICGRSSSFQLMCEPSTIQPATLPATVNDVAFLDESTPQVGPSNSRRGALAATSAGPYFAPRGLGVFLALDGGASATPVWRPVALPGLSDACDGTPAPIDRLIYELNRHLLAAVADQDRRLSVFTRASSPQNLSPCGTLALDPAYGPCEACGPGEVLVKVGMEEPIGDTDVVTLCRRMTADAGSEVVGYRHSSPDGGCARDSIALSVSASRGYHVAGATSGGLEGLDSIGQPRTCPMPDCSTMLWGTAPARVAGGPGLLATYTETVLDQTTNQTAPPSGFTSPLGLQIASFSDLFVTGSVVENPDWMISNIARPGTQGDQTLALMPMRQKFNDPTALILPYAVFRGSLDLLPTVGSIGQVVDSSTTKSFGTLTNDADGHPWLIVGAADRIWGVDARSLGDGGIVTIGIKAAPFPSADIQSIAFAAFDRGDAGTGPLLEGYTVEQQRLFRVVVHAPTLWLPDEIRLGVTDTAPVAVWMEGLRGRVGTSDGRVFGLPVPVVLSTAIPEAPLPTVLNYGSLCGQAFALSGTALYRLSLESPPLGTWKRVSLESAHPGIDGFAPHWAPVIHKARVGNQEHLYLFSTTGLVVDVVASCP